MSIRKSISLYIRYASVCVRSIMEYKLSFVLMIFGRCMIAFTEFLAIRFVFDGLTEIQGYTYGDVLLCFSVIHMSFTLSELIGNGFKVFSGIVKSGEFDRMLLRPCSPILQIIGTRYPLSWNSGKSGVLGCSDGVHRAPYDTGRNPFVYRTVYAGSQLLFLYHRGYFHSQRADLWCQGTRQVPY